MEMLFHPYLVHFPIAFFFLEAFLILLWYWKKDDRYEDFAYFVLKLALIVMPVVMLAGYLDAGGFPSRVRLHYSSATALFLVNGLRFSMRWRKGKDFWQGATCRMAIVLLLGSVFITGLTAHLGGLLVYS